MAHVIVTNANGKREVVCPACLDCADTGQTTQLTYEELDDVIGWTCSYCGAEDEDVKAEAVRRSHIQE